MPRYTAGSTRQPAQVLADIEHGKFRPVYILFGADSAAADDIIRALKEALVQPGMEAFDHESVRADELEIPILLQHIRQPPVASKRRLVVVRGLAQLAKGRPKRDQPDNGPARKDSLKELLDGLAALPDGCAVALTCDYSRPLQRALAAAGLGRAVIDLRKPSEAELAELIRRRSRDLGISLEPAAVRLLVEVSGEETTLLSGELEKLATAVEPGTSISEEDVRRLAGQSREFELNEYINRVLRRDSAGALAVLERLHDWGEEPVKIVAWLGGAFLRRLPGSDDEKRIRRCLLQLYEINRDIIGGHPEPFALLDTFTVCAACPESERYCSVYTDARPPEFCMRRKLRRDRSVRQEPSVATADERRGS